MVSSGVRRGQTGRMHRSDVACTHALELLLPLLMMMRRRVLHPWLLTDAVAPGIKTYLSDCGVCIMSMQVIEGAGWHPPQ